MANYVAYGFFGVLANLLITIILLRYYARKDTPWSVHANTGLSWMLTFCSLSFLIPMDMITDSGTRTTLKGVWDFVYWTSFTMTWFIIPIVQGYYMSGYFSGRDRLKSSIMMNIKFYLLVGILFFAFLIYIAVKNQFDRDQLVGFVICLSNVWGLALGVLLLGYGLVEVPRNLWYSGDNETKLRQVHFQASKIWGELDDAKEAVIDAIRTVRVVSGKIGRDDTYRRYYEIIQDATPLEEEVDLQRNSRNIEEQPITKDIRSAQVLTKDILASLHYHVKTVVRSLQITRDEWNEIVEKADELETMMGVGDVQSTPVGYAGFWRRIKYGYQGRFRPYIVRTLAILTAIMGMLLVWSEMTMFTKKNVSPFASLMKAVKDDIFALQLFAIITLSYLAFAAYYALFKFRVPGFYDMRGNRRTDEISILFNASFIMRLIGPLGFNFLEFTRQLDNTSFLQVVGQMDVVPFFGDKFYVYFPIFIGVFCFATLCNLYGRIVKFMGITNFDQKSGFAEESITEGQLLIKKERRKRLAAGRT